MTKPKHGHASRGSRTREYTAWSAMNTRCNNPAYEGYSRYGGRGIHICERWKSFDAFHNDMGKCPDGFTLDRYDSNGNYEPNNCRWADQATQQNNRRNNNLISFRGETKTLAQWAQERGFHWKTLKNRIDHGWSIERSLLEPVNQRFSRKRTSLSS